MNKTAIISASQNAFHGVTEKGYDTDEIGFFDKSNGKWSVAENIRHLILSTGTSTLAWQLPLVIVKFIGGTPNRNSRSYDELLEKYQQRLNEGGKASGRYVPKDAASTLTNNALEKDRMKKAIMYKWNKVSSKFIFSLSTRRTEDDLEKYLVRHPLLGRITLRELGYFSIFHTLHHLDSINKLTEKKVIPDVQYQSLRHLKE